MERLNKAIRTATTGDLQRAAMFLEGAREVRAGCTNQRAQARRAQSTAWKKRKWTTRLRGKLCSILNVMAQLHGNKAHYHVLIDPNRAELLFEKAAAGPAPCGLDKRSCVFRTQAGLPYRLQRGNGQRSGSVAVIYPQPNRRSPKQNND